jgi:hypothetical protein
VCQQANPPGSRFCHECAAPSHVKLRNGRRDTTGTEERKVPGNRGTAKVKGAAGCVWVGASRYFARRVDGMLRAVRACLRSRFPCQPAHHQVDHGDMNHCFSGDSQMLIVLAQAPIAIEPPERPFHDLPPGLHRKAWQRVRAFDDRSAQLTPHPQLSLPDQSLPSIRSIGQISRNRENLCLSRSSTSLAPAPSWILAACTITASTNPSVSTKPWRLRPLTRLPASNPHAPFFGRFDRLTIEKRGAGLALFAQGLPPAVSHGAITSTTNQSGANRRSH